MTGGGEGVAGDEIRRHNKILRDALGPLMECSEEPMLKAVTNQDYAVWRKQGERTLYASGEAFFRLTRYKIDAYLLPAKDAQEMAGRIRAALKDGGLQGVRELTRAYDITAERRQLSFMASVPEAL